MLSSYLVRFHFFFYFFSWYFHFNLNAAIGLQICAITAGIKKYIWIIKKKKKKHNKTVFIEKFKLNSIEVSIYKALVDSNLSHDEFVLINNVLKEFDDMKKEDRKF